MQKVEGSSPFIRSNESPADAGFLHWEVHVSEPVADIRYSGEVEVRPFRRGTYLGHDHLETLIERALGSRYQSGGGWKGFAVVSIALYEESPGRERGGDAGS
jgi:hypothetical protein